MPYPMLSQICGGFSPAPRNAVESFSIRYTGGVTIDYEGESAEILMAEILRAAFFATQLEVMQQAHAQAEEETEPSPAYHGKSFREYIQQEESKVKPPKES